MGKKKTSSGPKISIRKERSSDIDGIYSVNTAAFETAAEAELVNRLRGSGIKFISLVAERKKKIVGHIFFSPVTLIGNDSTLNLTGLAPMAVVPELQKRGIGSMLVNKGLEQCRQNGIDAAFVLGDPAYYRKFGFITSAKYEIISGYEVPEEAFMALELKEGILEGRFGIIKYHEEFDKL